MKSIVGLARAMRPQQWAKNLFVFAPLFFAGKWDETGVAQRAVAVFLIFCLLASGVYLINDANDREADRLHPVKRLRPIASGVVSAGLAYCVGAALIVCALAWARIGLNKPLIAGVCATYAAIQLLYTWWLKRVVILDVLCIASGFVLRLLAGGSAAFVQQSAWILVCTIFLSLFLALCKRRHEVVSLGETAASHRAILADYPPALLDQLISAATAGTLVTYALYTVDARTAEAHHLLLHDGRPSPILAATLPFVIFGVFRYLYLVYRRTEGGSPTSTLMRDPQSLVNGVLYGGTVLAIFHYAAR